MDLVVFVFGLFVLGLLVVVVIVWGLVVVVLFVDIFELFLVVVFLDFGIESWREVFGMVLEGGFEVFDWLDFNEVWIIICENKLGYRFRRLRKWY